MIPYLFRTGYFTVPTPSRSRAPLASNPSYRYVWKKFSGDNVLHDGHGNVKLGDFGIAIQKEINPIDGRSYFLQPAKGGGTCQWVAPEVLKGDGCSRRSDIW